MIQSRSLLKGLLLGLVLLSMIAVGDSSAVAGSGEANESVHALLSGLSDEQVRQMLIDELRKEQDLGGLGGEISGPSAPLAILLGGLEAESAESGDQFQQLWKGLPQVFPDLYKVLVSL